MIVTRARAISRLTESDGRRSTPFSSSSHLSDRPRDSSLLTEPLDSDDAASSSGSHPAQPAIVGQHQQRSSVWHAAVNIAGEIMGAGVLSLPHAVATLGWIPGITAALAFACCAAYSGILLKRVRTGCYPTADSFADLAHATVGPMFGTLTRCAVVASWALLLPYFLIAMASSLQLALPHAQWCIGCFPKRAALSAAMLILPLQLQTLHTISYAATLSTFAMVVAAAIVLGVLCSEAPAPAQNITHSLWPPALSQPGGATAFDVLEWAGGICAFVFAYQGQTVFLEIMREMRKPGRFGEAVLWANLLMGVVYTATIVVSYGARGDRVAAFLPDSLDESSDAARQAVGLLLTFHTGVCYLITGQPLHRALHAALFPSDAARHWREGRPSGPLRWLVVTSTMLCVSLVVAVTVPFFSRFQSLLGALTGVPSIFGWPPLFFLCSPRAPERTSPSRGDQVDRGLCYVFLIILLPALSAMGTVSALAAIVSHWRSAASPMDGC